LASWETPLASTAQHSTAHKPKFAKLHQASPSCAKLRQASPSFAKHRQAISCIGVEEQSKILLWRAGKHHFNEFEFDIFIVSVGAKIARQRC
jgi:hypothetical protein